MTGNLAEPPPDVETASDRYALRFSGSVGRWFLEVQARHTLDLLRGLPPGARVLDVGGGHGQLTPHLVEAGYDVTVLGSTPACAHRLRPWLETGRCRFQIGALDGMPFTDGSFDAVLAFRLLAHVSRWQDLLRELCRVARRQVVIDYASTRSLNRFSTNLFGLKKRVERDTRPFSLFSAHEIGECLRESGFHVTGTRPQFLLPMALHRSHRSAAVGRLLEWPGRISGATRHLGSPIILRAERRVISATTPQDALPLDALPPDERPSPS